MTTSSINPTLASNSASETEEIVRYSLLQRLLQLPPVPASGAQASFPPSPGAHKSAPVHLCVWGMGGVGVWGVDANRIAGKLGQVPSGEEPTQNLVCSGRWDNGVGEDGAKRETILLHLFPFSISPKITPAHFLTTISISESVSWESDLRRAEEAARWLLDWDLNEEDASLQVKVSSPRESGEDPKILEAPGSEEPGAVGSPWLIPKMSLQNSSGISREVGLPGLLSSD